MILIIFGHVKACKKIRICIKDAARFGTNHKKYSQEKQAQNKRRIIDSSGAPRRQKQDKVMAYSTIRQKVGECEICGKRSPLTKKQCHTCYWRAIKMKSVNKMAAKDDPIEDDLQDLIADADLIYSKWLRMSGADKDGTVSCFTCSLNMRWQNSQCGHYVKRGNLFLRWDQRNTRIQCEGCNIHKGGNYSKFTANLEAEHAGITQILLEEGHLVYKPSRDEIRGIISEYTNKLKQLK